MKKTILILTVALSIGALAQGGMGRNMNGSWSGHNKSGMMMNQVSNLTPEQQLEFEKLHDKYRKEMQKSMLDIKEVNLNIQKEMLAEKPNQKNIDKFIDQKTRLQSEHQKNMIKFRIEMKEKFGIEMMGGMNSEW